MVTEKVKRELEMLRRHLTILKYVVENEPIGILKLAEETGIPSHKVRYSLRVLEQEGSSPPRRRAPSPRSGPGSFSKTWILPSISFRRWREG